MNAKAQAKAAKAFAAKWAGRGDEKSETHSFWLELLHDIFGEETPTDWIRFEVPVKIKHTVAEGEKTTTRFIDAMIPSTQIVIEQKSLGIDLKKPAAQSGGDNLTAFEQAKRYADSLPTSQKPRWIVVCNFAEFHSHDMEKPNDAPQIVRLEALPKEYSRLQFLVDKSAAPKPPEEKISLDAGKIVGRLYDALKRQYKDPESRHAKESLNKLCVRLVFCLYAEDAGIFDHHNMFHDYLATFQPQNVRLALIELFKALSTPEAGRDPYMNDNLAAFPYVNGGLFEDENIEIPNFTDEILDILLNHASDDFDWSQISPPIFGALFESTLSGDVRRAGGMHYTSRENIHKVIDPLFLDDLKAEFEKIKAGKRPNVKRKDLLAFQKKLASLVFLDPAAGSGNFLTETYLSLRRMENEILKELLAIRASTDKDKSEKSSFLYLTDGDDAPIQVSIKQFYGIEINGYAVAVAQTALWIAESQMMKETEEAIGEDLAFLPLKSNPNIIEGNALTLDWESIVPKYKLNYIMGNPPFVANTVRVSGKDAHSAAMLDEAQKKDRLALFGKAGGILDYVACWYKKASLFMESTKVRAAFVSTNSITQGQQVAPLWKPLFNSGVKINFAHQTFKWNAETTDMATVFVVIIGFSYVDDGESYLFSGESKKIVPHINAYLMSAEDVFVEKRSKPLSEVTAMLLGGKATDNNNLILTEKEKNALLQREPQSEKFLRPYMMGADFIDRTTRYCLWLVNAEPSEIKKCPSIAKRVEAVREFRLKSTKAATRKKADTPMLFDEIKECFSPYIAIPQVSSGSRKYIPIDYLQPKTIAGNMLYMVQDASLYHFGVLTSNVHMAWQNVVCSKYGPSYRYSNTLAYNNFPWPSPTDAQKARIEETAQMILDARNLYPKSTFADLYDTAMMPPELRKAHEANDKAVMAAYGFKASMAEPEIVAELLERYRQLCCRE